MVPFFYGCWYREGCFWPRMVGGAVYFMLYIDYDGYKGGLLGNRVKTEDAEHPNARHEVGG